MNQRRAFEETIARARLQGMPEQSPLGEAFGLAHLVGMQQRIAEGTFSESKLGRWLGWAQAAVVAANIGLGLEDMKQINLRHADADPTPDTLADVVLVWGSPADLTMDSDGGGQFASTFKLTERGAAKVAAAARGRVIGPWRTGARVDLGVGDVMAEVTHERGTVEIRDEDGGKVDLTASEIIGLADWLRATTVSES